VSLTCVRMCVIARRHLADCPDPDTCPGCLPRGTIDGTLVCDACTWRAVHALAQIPGLVAHLRDNIAPGATQPGPDIKRTKGDAAPAPLNLTAVADADDLHAELASWVLLVLEEHPDHLTGPTWRGSDIRPAAKRRTEWGENVYHGARVVGTRGNAEDTRRIARWLHTHHDWILSQPWTDDYVTAMPDRYWTTAARWPVEERAKYLPTPCPNCDRLTLKRYPPTFASGPVTIACAAIDCRHAIPEEQYGLATRVSLHRQREAQKEPAA
jgi:hypothetical protein